MATKNIKTTSNQGPFQKISERLKKFIEDFIKLSKKTPDQKTPVKSTKLKAKPARKKTVVKKKTTTPRKMKPKTTTGV